MESVLGGRYRLIDVIGQGGTSVVWRARDELLDRDVAAKILREGGDEMFRSSIRAEAKAAARLTNPRIAHIYDYGETSTASGPVPYLVMELVAGQPLSGLLDAENVLPWRQAASVGAQISEALLAAHALGLVHRDIKPDNVILTDSGVKLIDFGISALVGAPDMDEHGRLLGTAAYVAPERLADAPVGVAADVYSLGVLLYRMLAGTIPWETDSRTQLLAAHLFVAPNPLPPIAGMPARLAELCAACIDKEPSRRPAISALAAELRDLAETVEIRTAATAVAAVVDPAPATAAFAEPGLNPTAAFTAPALTADREGPSEEVVWPPRRSRKRLAIAGGIAACAIVLSIAAWSRSAGPDPSATGTATIPCTAEFAMTRDTGAGFDAKVTVTSLAATTTPSWSVGFGFSGDQHITTRTAPVAVRPGDRKKHTAAVRQSGGAVTVSGTGRIAAQESLAIAMAGTYHSVNPIPTQVSLNGHDCRTSVNGPATPPTTAPKPAPSSAGSSSAAPSTPPSEAPSTTPSPPSGPGTPIPTPTLTPVDPVTDTPSTGGHGSKGPGGDGGGDNGGGPGPH